MTTSALDVDRLMRRLSRRGSASARPGSRRSAVTARVLLACSAIVAIVAACGVASAPARPAGDGSVIAAAAGPSAAPQFAGGGSSSENGGGSKGIPGPSGVPAPLDDQKIVRTGSLDLEVANLDQALAKAHASIVGLGGYVGQSRQTNDGDRSTATVTYRIPADRWDEALTALRGIASKVVSEQTDAVEVTGQLIDMNARLDNLRASEKALQAILEKATKVSDILDVQARLTDVRGQIEELDAQRAHLADQAALGTLAVTYALPVVAVAEATQSWSLSDEIDRAAASLVDVLHAVAAAAIWFVIVWLPVLVVLGVLGGLLVVVMRRLGLRRPSMGGPTLPGPTPPAAVEEA